MNWNENIYYLFNFEEDSKAFNQMKTCFTNNENNYENNENNENNNFYKEYCIEEKEDIKYREIGIQTVGKYEEIKNNKNYNNIIFKEIYETNKIYDNNHNNKEIEIEIENKKEINLQTLNNYEENESQDKIKKAILEVKDNTNYNNNKIFDIKKTLKKKSIFGRKKKILGLLGKHNKYSLDNIIRKFKSRFINSSLNYINKQFKNKNKKLLKIICNQSKEINRNKNILWLNNKMKNVFYEDISNKTYNSNKNYNRELIDKIYKEKYEKKVIELLDLTVSKFMKLYYSKNKINVINLLDEIINELKIKGETEMYINKFKIVSENFVSIIQGLKSRERKKNSLNNI